MRRFALGVALASLTLVAACGGDDPESPAAPTESADPGTDDATESADPGSDDATESADPGSDDATALTGVVGTPDDPDAFVITLTDESGEPVSTLPAGDYEVEISDLSAIHNFHLRGGDVNESTTVAEVADVTWSVTLEPGDYSFMCDPHPSMSGQFTVT